MVGILKKKVKFLDQELEIKKDVLESGRPIIPDSLGSIQRSSTNVLDLFKPGQHMSFRISHIKASLQEIFDIFSPTTSQLVLCEETATKAGKHWHGIMFIESNIPVGVENKLFRKWAKALYPILDTPRSFSCSLVEKEEAFSYVCKDGCYLYKGISDEQMSIYASKSYKKFDKTIFAQEWDAIRMDKTIKSTEKCFQYVKLKRKYNQNVKLSDIENLYITFKCDENDMFIRTLVNTAASSVSRKMDPDNIYYSLFKETNM